MNSNDKIDEEDLELVRSIGDLNVSVKHKPLSYSIEELKVMIVKLILNDENRSSGICHIKTKINLKSDFLSNFIKREIPFYNVEEAFHGVKLEYPVFITTSDPINAEIMVEDLKRVDEKLNEFLKNRSSV